MMIHFHTQKEKTKKNYQRKKKKKRKKERKKYNGYTVFVGNYLFFEITLLSPHVREFGFRNPGNLGLWSPESWKLLLWNPESLAM